MTSTAKEMKEPPVYPIEVGQDNPEKLNYYITVREPLSLGQNEGGGPKRHPIFSSKINF